MCYYEDEYWPSRYHDPAPSYVPDPPPKPKPPEFTFEDFICKVEALREESKRTFKGFEF